MLARPAPSRLRALRNGVRSRARACSPLLEIHKFSWIAQVLGAVRTIVRMAIFASVPLGEHGGQRRASEADADAAAGAGAGFGPAATPSLDAKVSPRAGPSFSVLGDELWNRAGFLRLR